jgi:hypothetical protein
MPLKPDGTTTSIWSDSVDGVRLQHGFIIHFLGTTPINVSPEITNGSTKTIVFVGAQLMTNGRTLNADIPWAKEVTKRTLAPGARARITCRWTIPRRKPGEVDNLGPRVTITWQLKIGDKERVVKEEIVRTPGN